MYPPAFCIAIPSLFGANSFSILSHAGNYYFESGKAGRVIEVLRDTH
jgi:hypothetical protein